MKANELMIGDWVSESHSGCIDAMNDIAPYDENIQLQQDDFGLDECFFGRLSPIPLTPEILEKNGFENVGSEVYECDVLPFYIWWERDRHRLGIDIEDSTYDKENFAQMLRVPVSYVHELQHALRLCGIKKEIVL